MHTPHEFVPGIQQALCGQTVFYGDLPGESCHMPKFHITHHTRDCTDVTCASDCPTGGQKSNLAALAERDQPSTKELADQHRKNHPKGCGLMRCDVCRAFAGEPCRCFFIWLDPKTSSHTDEKGVRHNREQCYATKPESTGMKFDQEKARYDLLPFKALAEIVSVLTYGAKKYAPENWRKVEHPKSRYFAAALRHLVAWFGGERLDPESGHHHLAHAACCIMFLLELDKP